MQPCEAVLTSIAAMMRCWLMLSAWQERMEAAITRATAHACAECGILTARAHPEPGGGLRGC